MGPAPTSTSTSPLSMLLRWLESPPCPAAAPLLLSVLGLLLSVLASKAAENPADARLLHLLVQDELPECVSSSTGSGQVLLGTCVIRQMRAVSGTLLTGRTSLARKELISVLLPAVQDTRQHIRFVGRGCQKK
jgi:hypothetical protein